MTGHLILVGMDPDTARMFKVFFTGNGYQVIIANTLKPLFLEAVSLPDLILVQNSEILGEFGETIRLLKQSYNIPMLVWEFSGDDIIDWLDPKTDLIFEFGYSMSELKDWVVEMITKRTLSLVLGENPDDA